MLTEKYRLVDKGKMFYNEKVKQGKPMCPKDGKKWVFVQGNNR